MEKLYEKVFPIQEPMCFNLLKVRILVLD